MAAKDQKKTSDKGTSSASPRFDPKPVQVGGDTLVERLRPHVKKIAVATLITALVLIVVFTIRWFGDRKHEKSTAKLADVLDVAGRQVRAPGEPADPKAIEPSFADSKARAEAVLDEMTKLPGAHTDPAFKGAMLLEAGKIDDAIAEYTRAENAQGIEGVLAREGLGVALERKAESETKDPAARQKDYQDALNAYASMQPDEQGPGRARSLYHQGRVLIQLQKVGEARTMLQKAKDLAKTQDPSLVLLIDERLISLGAG